MAPRARTDPGTIAIVSRPRRPSIAVVVIAASMLVVAVTVAGYAMAGTHKVVPGVRGCELMRSTKPQSRCVVQLLRGEMSGRSTEAGLRRVDHLAETNALVASHCHLAMHPLGEVAGARAARRRETPPAANGASNCRRGFMHGMMLGFVSHGSGGNVASSLPALCTRDRQDERSCAHVVGHLIAREAGQAHAERSIADGCIATTVAKDTAATTPVTKADETECIRGGYMEIALTAQQPPLETWRRRCEHSPARGREECFAWLPPLASYRQLSQREAAGQCDHERRGSTLHEACIAGVSRVLTGSSPCASFEDDADRSACAERRGS